MRNLYGKIGSQLASTICKVNSWFATLKTRPVSFLPIPAMHRGCGEIINHPRLIDLLSSSADLNKYGRTHHAIHKDAGFMWLFLNPWYCQHQFSRFLSAGGTHSLMTCQTRFKVDKDLQTPFLCETAIREETAAGADFFYLLRGIIDTALAPNAPACP